MAEQEQIKTIEDVEKGEIEELKAENEKLKEESSKIQKQNLELYNALIEKIKKTPAKEETDDDEEKKRVLDDKTIKKFFDEASKEIAERIKEKW